MYIDIQTNDCTNITFNIFTTNAKMKKQSHTQNVCITLMLFKEKNANNKVEEYNK